MQYSMTLIPTQYNTDKRFILVKTLTNKSGEVKGSVYLDMTGSTVLNKLEEINKLFEKYIILCNIQ